MTGPAFPTDEVTLSLLEHALGGVIDDGGGVTGADMNVGQLLEMLSPRMDETEVERRHDVASIVGDEVVDLTDLGWVYHRDDVIRALLAKIRELQHETGKKTE